MHFQTFQQHNVLVSIFPRVVTQAHTRTKYYFGTLVLFSTQGVLRVWESDAVRLKSFGQYVGGLVI